MNDTTPIAREALGWALGMASKERNRALAEMRRLEEEIFRAATPREHHDRRHDYAEAQARAENWQRKCEALRAILNTLKQEE